MGILELKNIRHSYGATEILKGVSLRLDPGEILCICGPSGSGKSTLLRIMNGLETFTSGEIYFQGTKIDPSPKSWELLRRKIGFVFQQFHLYPHLTALDNITLALEKVLRQPQDQAKSKAMTLLGSMGLQSKAHSFPAELSGGEQQRVAIARALAMEPQLLLLDEPTSSLDPEMVHEVLQVLRALARQQYSMVIVTHEMAFAKEISNRMVFIDQGEILEIAKTETFFTNTRDPRTRAFIEKILKP